MARNLDDVFKQMEIAYGRPLVEGEKKAIREWFRTATLKEQIEELEKIPGFIAKNVEERKAIEVRKEEQKQIDLTVKYPPKPVRQGVVGRPVSMVVDVPYVPKSVKPDIGEPVSIVADVTYVPKAGRVLSGFQTEKRSKIGVVLVIIAAIVAGWLAVKRR